MCNVEEKVKDELSFDDTKFRNRTYFTETGNAETIVQCIGCEILFIGVNSKYLKQHEYVKE